ncbi:type 1 fimbrial protein [Xylella fastidiosa]|nr:type 1 fimbrial protein [Xylella fastidiosa]
MSINNEFSATRTTRYQKRIWKVAAICMAMLLVSNVQAACFMNSDAASDNIQINLGRILIKPSLAIGDRITLWNYNIPAGPVFATCYYGGSTYTRFARSMTAVSGMDHVYQTDIPGVGIRISSRRGQEITYPPSQTDYYNALTYVYQPAETFEVELIKTATTTGSGTILSSGLLTTNYTDGTGPGRPRYTSTISGFVVTSTCEVDNGSRNIAVNFGTVPSNTFNGLGSKGPEHDFAINLICQGGNVAEADQGLISVRIDATQDKSMLPGVLAITPATDAASNVGIELVDVLNGNEHKIVFGQAIVLGRTPVNASSTLQLPMRGRYIQTQTGKVGPGTANGTATFTIEYQ